MASEKIKNCIDMDNSSRNLNFGANRMTATFQNKHMKVSVQFSLSMNFEIQSPCSKVLSIFHRIELT